ncbi:hypothetical protein C8F01DRAFT_1261485 [Mycena amicta]|nr:hypothetical protein C8F01DRAFT_1261485 [Mycena amicta]
METDDPRAKTLHALKAFIDQQKALLARTKADIDTLRKLRAESITDVGDLADQLKGSAYRLSEAECHSGGVPEDLDWSLFTKKDPKPLNTLARGAHTAHAARNKPKTTSTSGLSELQKFIRNARKTIIDPVMALYGEPENENSTASDPNAPRPLPLRGPSGLFIRRPTAPAQPRAPRPHRQQQHPMPPDDARSSAGSSTIVDVDECSSPLPMALAKPKRTRRISTKLERQNPRPERGAWNAHSSNEASSLLRVPPLSALPQRTGADNDHDSLWDWTEDEPDSDPPSSRSPSPDPTPLSVLGKRRRPPAKPKPKSETFKLPWTASEQNLPRTSARRDPCQGPQAVFQDLQGDGWAEDDEAGGE